MSERSYNPLEEEKRRFDRDIDAIERKATSKLEDSTKPKSNYELLEQCNTLYFLMKLELDLELSESSLMSKAERKKQFVGNMQALQDKKQR